MLKRIDTRLLLRETQTDGHAPMVFMCSNDDIYYCKYLPTGNPEEINCLAYEVIAHELLRALDISTPEIALVAIAENTINKELITTNKRIRVGNVCFGSKEIAFASEIQSLTQLKNKTDFNKLLNPLDIIKIALFDLWVNNVDRGRDFGEGLNYNLLLKPVGKSQQIIAFDHAFIFGGTDQIGIFNEKMASLRSNKLYQSGYYKSVIKYIDKVEYLNVVNNFIPLLSKNYDTLITNIIQELSAHWQLSINLDERIMALLKSKARIQEIKNIIIQAKK
jgi:hypothetical protein